MKYWKRGLKEMSDKTILEQWRAIAYDQQADRNKLQRFWANYFNIEKGIYEQLLSNPDEVVTGTVKELAEKYGQEVLTMVGFLDGINDSLKIPNPIETMDENTKVSLCFDKELLYKNMVDARADWLYELPQWMRSSHRRREKNFILSRRNQEQLSKQRKSDVMILVLAEAARNINIAAVRMRKHPNLEYIIVLGAHVEGTRLTKALLERTRRALQYMEENPETKAVLSGGKGDGESITEAQAMCNYLVEHGIDRERLILEEKSTNTTENLKFSLGMIGLNHSVGIVTNNFHVFRGTAIGKKCGCREIYPIPSRYRSWRLLIYIPREILAIIKDKLMGNM